MSRYATSLSSVVILALAVIPVFAEAALAHQATPGPAIERETVFVAPIASGGRATATLYFARLVYEPGQGDVGLDFDGPAVVAVASGVVLAQTVARGDEVLDPGAAIALRPRTFVSLQNEGPGRAEAFLVAVLGSDLGNPGGLFAARSSVLWPLLGKGVVAPFATPATLTVERLVVPPGASLRQADVAGVEAVNVASGVVLAALEEGQAEVSSGAILRTGAIGPGAVFLAAGQERRLREDAGLFVRPGATYALRNEGDEAATLLVMRLVPDEEIDGPPAVGTPSG